MLGLARILRSSPLLIIALVVLAANWQLLFGVYPIKWDSSNYWHPWRYFISECYNNGIVPLWDPFTQSGYPIHGDLQGPAYSIDAIVTSFLFKGSVFSINLVFLAYLVFGAYGFYKLSSFVQANASLRNYQRISGTFWPAAMAGIMYSLSGFVTAHGHNLYIVISTGLLPWMYYYYFRIVKEGNVYNAIKLSIIFFFQLTAGNPSFLIVSLYFFAITYLIYGIGLFRKRRYAALKKSITAFAWTGLLSGILCAPVILNAALIFADSTRGSGVSMAWAGLENSPLTGLFTFFTPFAGFENGIDGVTRQPIISYYIGAFSLFFAVIGFVKFRSVYLRMLGVFAVFAFLLSLGLDTPLFGWLHRFLPFFNVFRMPKLIFIYDLFYLLLLFSLGLRYVFAKGSITRKQWTYYLVFALLLIAASLAYFKWGYMEALKYDKIKSGSIVSWFWSTTQVQRSLVSGGITLFLLLLAFLVLKSRKWKQLLLVLMLADIVISYNCTAIVRIYEETDISVKERYIASLPKKFPVPENLPPKEALFLSVRLYPFWMNAANYLKQPEFTNSNSFALKNHAVLEDEHPDDFNYITGKPLATFVDTLKEKITAADTGKYTVAVCNAQTIAATGHLQKNKGDTIIFNQFKPGHLEFTVSNRERVGFLLQQTYNRFWKIKVNGKEQQPVLAYYSFPLLILQPGKNEISFSYEVPYFPTLFCLSLGLFCLLLVLLILRMKKGRWMVLIGFASIAGYCVLMFDAAGNKGRHYDAGQFAEDPSHVYVVNNTNRLQVQKRGISYNFLYPGDVAAFMENLPRVTEKELACKTTCTYYPPELDRVIEACYGPLSSIHANNEGSIHTFKKGPGKEKIIYEQQLQDTALANGLELKPGREFSAAMKVELKSIDAKPYDLVVIEAEAESEDIGYVGLYFSVEGKAGTKKILSDHAVRNKDRRKHFCIFYMIPTDFDKADLISTTFWNNKTKPVYLHSLSWKVIRKPN